MSKIIEQAYLQERAAPLIDRQGRIYRKYRNVLAKVAAGGEVVESVTSAGKETVNTAVAGDFIVRNQTEAGEQYIVGGEKFRERYGFLRDAEGGYAEYYPKGKVRAIELTKEVLAELALPSRFYYEAPWGEKARALRGDFFVCPVGGESEVYRIGRKEFFETYQVDE